MEIVYVPDVDTPLISVIAPEISDFYNNIDDYTNVTITASLICATPPITQLYDTTDVLINTSKFYIDFADADNIELIVKPQLFSGATKFVDGIYRFDIKFSTTSGFTIISNCLFIDITLACKVAGTLHNIVEENKIKVTEKISTIIHILHYSLVNGSNCGCNCDEMCEVYNDLKSLLLDIDPQILNDCGC